MKQLVQADSKEFSWSYLLNVKIFYSDKCSDFVVIKTKMYDLKGEYNFHPISKPFVQLNFSYIGFSIFASDAEGSEASLAVESLFLRSHM